MGENTKIEWCSHTFNPWLGCQKVSPGCDNCYAESMMDHRYGKVEWGPHGERKRTSETNWRQPKLWNKKANSMPPAGGRPRVFCASLSDVFDNQVPEQWRKDLFDLIWECPKLDWLLLTKRPENIVKFLPSGFSAETWPHVWLGVTTEDQKNADHRVPILLNTPARVRFVSYEPALGPVDFCNINDASSWEKRIDALRGRWSTPDCSPMLGNKTEKLDWIIAGGESGKNARPAHPQWFRSVRDQCAAAGVPFLFKQWGRWSPDNPGLHKISAKRYSHELVTFQPNGTRYRADKPEMYHAPGMETLYQHGVKAKGRLLDGVTHDGVPA